MSEINSALGIKIIEKAFIADLRDKAKKLKERKSTNAKCALFVENWIHKNFDSEGKLATGGGWQPLSEMTLKLRIKGKGQRNPKILHDRGWLRNKWKRYYTDEDAIVESGVDYGEIHEHGGWITLKINPKYHRGKNAPPASTHKIKIPQRKILPTKDKIWPKIQEIYKKFLNEILK